MPPTVRQVRSVHRTQTVREGAGVLLQRVFPAQGLEDVDPFLLLDHFGSDDPADYRAGFPMHPHRGIETVTYLLAGAVRHEDSLGNGGTISSGDLQWMSSGGGIMHEEMPEARDGHMEGFQLWVNLPAKLKMSEPRYREIPAAEVPVVNGEDGSVLRVIAGEAGGVRGPVRDVNGDPLYLDIELPPGAGIGVELPADHAAFVYAFRGSGSVGPPDQPRQLDASTLAVLGEGESFLAHGGEETFRMLLIAGKALGEPVARYGPFVMNTREEIQQALEDLKQGRFEWRPGRE